MKQLSIIENQEIEEVLSSFGLSANEQKVYLSLLSLGKSTLSPLSKMANLNLTTVQSIVKRLINLGLTEVSLIKTRSLYQATEPITLKKILENKIKEVSTIIPFLKKIQQEEVVSSKIKVYYKDRMTEIFNQILEEEEDEVLEIVSAEDFQEIIGEKFHFTKRRVEKNIKLKSLRIENQEIKKYNSEVHEKELRQAKFLPAELTFRNSIMIWQNKVAFFTTKEEGLAWIVESSTQNEMWRQLFELLWSVSRKMETANK